MTATLAFKAIEGCVLLMHNDCVPNDEEFRAYLDFCNRTAEAVPVSAAIGALIFVDGDGMPTPKQRAMVQQVLKGRAAGGASAILTLNPAVRALMTALSWVGRPIRAFKPIEVQQAFEYLGAPSLEMRQEAFRCLLEMRAKMAGLHADHDDGGSQVLHRNLATLRSSHTK